MTRLNSWSNTLPFWLPLTLTFELHRAEKRHGLLGKAFDAVKNTAIAAVNAAEKVALVEETAGLYAVKVTVRELAEKVVDAFNKQCQNQGDVPPDGNQRPIEPHASEPSDEQDTNGSLQHHTRVLAEEQKESDARDNRPGSVSSDE